MMKQFNIKNVIIFILLGFVWTSVNAAGQPTDQEKEKIKKQFKAKLPQIQVDSVFASPIEGLYQVNSGPLVVYVTQDARYAISGDILDLGDGKTNITEEARKTVRMKALAAVKDHMIIFASEKPKYTVTVFTDLDCGYCQKFHAQMDKMNALGITIRYVAFPRAGIGSQTYKRSMSVWCAKDPKAAFTAVASDQDIEEVTCKDHMIDAQYNLGVKTGISGTPTLVLEDGSIVEGYVPSDKLLSILKKHK